MMPPSVRYRGFQLPKRGHRPDECEDAFAAEGARFAIADGATDSAHAGVWARLLVNDFVQSNHPVDAWPDSLTPLQRRWNDEIAPRAGASPMPWFVEERQRQGAFATFLGLTMEAVPGGGWSWQAVADGDSCLFHVQDGGLVASFPMKRAEEFSNSPWLVGSRTGPHGIERMQGMGRETDRLWLLTDALALWFLREVEAKGGSRGWNWSRFWCRRFRRRSLGRGLRRGGAGSGCGMMM